MRDVDPEMTEEKGKVCRNYNDPSHPGGCLKTPDPRYTMDFSDVDPENGVLYWCSFCGSTEHALLGAIEEAFETRPGFAKEFAVAIESAEAKEREGLH